eukprot:583357-Rhodomonas_salina.3
MCPDTLVQYQKSHTMCVGIHLHSLAAAEYRTSHSNQAVSGIRHTTSIALAWPTNNKHCVHITRVT